MTDTSSPSPPSAGLYRTICIFSSCDTILWPVQRLAARGNSARMDRSPLPPIRYHPGRHEHRTTLLGRIHYSCKS